MDIQAGMNDKEERYFLQRKNEKEKKKEGGKSSILEKDTFQDKDILHLWFRFLKTF